MLCFVQGFTNKGKTSNSKSKDSPRNSSNNSSSKRNSLQKKHQKQKDKSKELEQENLQQSEINSSLLALALEHESQMLIKRNSSPAAVGSVISTSTKKRAPIHANSNQNNARGSPGVIASGGNGAMSPNATNAAAAAAVQVEGNNSSLESTTIPTSEAVTPTTPTPGTGTGSAATSVGSTSPSTATSPTERQSLKHLSASAPAIRSTAVMRNGASPELSNDFVLAPSSSKSRQKKFHRHFTSVPLEETVLDYYSCALVADILLQGYLYITENHFAFYSNVFGYVTKVLIPVNTVVRVTKERTAKIIPNAVGVCTRTEKHVFASLLSRDTTHKLMCNVWQYSIQLEADNEVNKVKTKIMLEEQLKISAELAKTAARAQQPDESSGGESGSGNDSAMEPRSYSPSPLNSPGVEKVLLVAKNSASALTASTSSNDETCTQTFVGSSSIMPPNVQLTQTSSAAYLRPGHRTSIVQGPPAISNLTTAFANENRKRSQSFSTMGIGQAPSLIVLATAILVILFISAAVLLSRISILHQKISERPVVHDSEQFYQELLAWQTKLHSSSADEIHQYINMNLQQIVRVRQSLEALSTLFMSNQPGGSDLKDSVNPHDAVAAAVGAGQ